MLQVPPTCWRHVSLLTCIGRSFHHSLSLASHRIALSTFDPGLRLVGSIFDCGIDLSSFFQRPQVSQTITVGSSFSCSTPRSASSMSMSSTMWTPSRGAVTKAGGLGRGSNPLDSFFPFDPYLLRRSHVYVASMYNSWKVRTTVSWF